MANRFQNIGFQPKNIEFFPEVQKDILPDISGLGNYMQSLDQQLDQELELPDYVQQSESDRNAYLNYKKEAQGYKERAIQAFKSGKNDLGAEELRQYKNFLRNSKQPDGTYTRLEQGKDQYNAQVKRLQDMYMKGDNADPMLYNYSIDLLNKGISPFEDEFGNARAQIDSPNMVADKPRKDAAKYLDTIVDNIKADEIVKTQHMSKVRGMNFKQLMTDGSTEFIDENKVFSVIMDAVSPEMKASFEQYGRALGLEGQGNVIDKDKLAEYNKRIENKDTEGLSVLDVIDSSSSLGSLVRSLIKSKVYSKDKSTSKVITDSYGLQRAAQFDEYNLGREIQRSTVISKGSGMVPLNIDAGGKVQIGGIKYVTQPVAGQLVPGIKKQAFKAFEDVSLAEYAKSDKGELNHPGLKAVTDAFPQGSMDNKTYNKLIDQKYNEKMEKMSMADVQYRGYGDSKAGNYERNKLIGLPNKGAGNITEKSIMITSANGNPTPVNFEKLIDTLGVTLEEFREGATLLGEVLSTNPLVPSGKELIYTSPEGESTRMLVSDISIQDAKIKSPIYEFSKVAHDGSIEETDYIFTGIPALDARGKTRAVGIDVYSKDIYNDIKYSEYSTEAQVREAKKELAKIEANPYLNKFEGTKVKLQTYNPNNPELPIDIKDTNGNLVTLEDLEIITSQSAKNYNN